MTREPEIAQAEVAGWAERLLAVLRSLPDVAVAFSGGVDSTVVAKAARLVQGERALAVTATSASLAQGELERATSLARAIGIRHRVIQTDEFADTAYARNDGTRCYHCKSNLYGTLERLRDEVGFAVVCSGANLDDQGDYRPGLVAAAEHGVRHPLQEAGLTKPMVRAIARHWGLPNWDKAASPCLSSRLAIGVEATAERTQRVDQAERYLRELGLGELRVRYHPGEHARIEVPLADLPRLVEPEIRSKLAAHFRSLGFQFVSLDLEGFRSGGLNVLVPAELLRSSAPRP